MKVEIREDSVLISGYVNAVERYSKPIRERVQGKIRTFIEKIKAGVFKIALKRNKDVKVLLNHDMKRELATTANGSAKLEEDTIGLRAEVEITDPEVIEKAKNNKLVGWSFGFHANSDLLGMESNNTTRTITDLDLFEVSILDDSKSPAYYGTSIEARNAENKTLEIRNFIELKEGEEMEDKKQEEQVKEEVQEELKEETNEEDKKIEILAEKIANIVIAKLQPPKDPVKEEKELSEDEPKPEQEQEKEKEQEPKQEEVQEDKKEEEKDSAKEEEEKRSIDYSYFDNILSQL